MDSIASSNAQSNGVRVDRAAIHAAPAARPERIGLPGVLFVRGCARSGTSLVAELLNDSPDLAILSEYALNALRHDLGPIFAYEREQNGLNSTRSNLYAEAAPGASAADLLFDVPADQSPTGRQRRLRIAPQFENATDFYMEHEAALPSTHYPTARRAAEILTAVVESSLGKRDARIIGSKTPGSHVADDHDTLASEFPAVRYLFVVRNPFDTINSILNRRNLARHSIDVWLINDVECAIREYRDSVVSLLAHVAAYGDAVFVLKYEDLLERWAEVSGTLGAFLGVALDPHSPRITRERARKPVLTAAESAAVLAEFSGPIAAWPGKALTGLGTRSASALIDCLGTVVPGRTYRFGGTPPQRPFLGLGWNEPEPQGVWSRETHADALFTVTRSGNYAVCAELSTFATAAETPVSIGILLDGKEIFRALAVPAASELLDATSGTMPVFAGATPRTVVCGPVEIRAGELHRLTFEVDAVRSPAECGLSEDPRKLGVCFHSLLFASADRP